MHMQKSPIYTQTSLMECSIHVQKSPVYTLIDMSQCAEGAVATCAAVAAADFTTQVASYIYTNVSMYVMRMCIYIYMCVAVYEAEFTKQVTFLRALSLSRVFSLNKCMNICHGYVHIHA